MRVCDNCALKDICQYSSESAPPHNCGIIVNGRIESEESEVLKIIKKYYESDGWSNGGVVKFWEMKPDELKKVKEYLDDK